MTRTIIISLPVRDLNRSKTFYQAIGATLDPRFSDETGAFMAFSDAIQVVLLTHEKWATFTHKPIPDARKGSEMALSISCESRDAVNAMINAAQKAGGAIDTNPVQENEFMFGRDFEDPDGHALGALWWDPKGMPAKTE